MFLTLEQACPESISADMRHTFYTTLALQSNSLVQIKYCLPFIKTFLFLIKHKDYDYYIITNSTIDIKC